MLPVISISVHQNTSPSLSKSVNQNNYHSAPVSSLLAACNLIGQNENHIITIVLADQLGLNANVSHSHCSHPLSAWLYIPSVMQNIHITTSYTHCIEISMNVEMSWQNIWTPVIYSDVFNFLHLFQKLCCIFHWNLESLCQITNNQCG